MIRDIVNPKAPIRHVNAVIDDPQKRKPDISVAERELKWRPQFRTEEGLAETIRYFKNKIEQDKREMF